MKSSEYLDALRARLSLPSDYALAKRLGITASRISNYRNNRNDFGPDLVPLVAELLGIDPAVLVADLAAERATTTFERDAFKRLAELARAAAVAASVTAVTIASAGLITEFDAYTYRTLTELLETAGENSKKRRRKRQEPEKPGDSEVAERPPKARVWSIFRRTVKRFCEGRSTGAADRASVPADWVPATS